MLWGRPPFLVVTPEERQVEGLAEDLATLAREAGLQETGVHAFPAPGPAPFRGLPRHPEAELQRAAALHAACRGRLVALVASPAGLLRPSLSPSLFQTRQLCFREGEEMLPEILVEALEEAGYRREDPVIAPGQYAQRGGILDLFPPDRERPVRIELFGDQIESLRSFDPETQRAVAPVDSFEILPLSDLFLTVSNLAPLRERIRERFPASAERADLLERLDSGRPPEDVVDLLPLLTGVAVPPWAYLPEAHVVALEPEVIRQQAEDLHRRALDARDRIRNGLQPQAGEALVSEAALAERLARPPGFWLREVDPERRGLHLSGRAAPRYSGDLRRLTADLHSTDVPAVLFLGTMGRAERLRDLLREEGLTAGAGLSIDVRVGALSTGFELPDPGLRLLADGDIFPEEVHLHARGRARGVRGFLSDFRDLKPGDLVVHQDHGVGRFEGLETLDIEGRQRELMVLVYRGGDKLKVPIEGFDQIQKYASAEGARPVIDQLGAGSWAKVKRRVKKAMRDMAAELLRLYAQRKARPGHAFTARSPWQAEFETSFEYEETADQAAAIADVERDMADPAPMDRLICGDVGYGKTEVAMRAAMRAVLDAKQVVVLAPTTVLAFQHWKTFRKRFAPFPVMVEMVSRFRKPRQIAAVLEATAAGKVDVLIGTHRLLSKDVVFRDLGLLIVDEEQRFGVAAKERLKQLRSEIDCLTLSATPIPRTLQMGLSGIRDMSVIETPPKDRLAIHTSVLKFSTDTIATAIRQELARDGQVYFVHNRVVSIYSMAHLVQRLVPEARVVVAHGQLPEAQLERAMLQFVEGRADVLVATTIIENGLDIPRANTIVINRADRYGLAQLYQLRGRVGRADRRANAFLLVPPDTALSEIARRRLAAIREFSELGAGFRIAALDLELRGAGNLLGGEQSGHIHAVGLDLYVKLLEQTIQELKGEAPERPRATLNLGADLRIPAEYVPEVQQRLSLYKRLSQARTLTEIEALRAEIRERYGPLPEAAQQLIGYAGLRLRAERLALVQVDRAGASLRSQLDPQTPLPPGALVALVEKAGAALTPQGVLRWPITARPRLSEPLASGPLASGPLASGPLASGPLAALEEMLVSLEGLLPSAQDSANL
jgi:transcription-repair coupling factor (superfamily II helicase)